MTPRLAEIEAPAPPRRRARLLHFYEGYSDRCIDPPTGAVAICGHVRRADALGLKGVHTDPMACFVCNDLLGMS